jgi:hypothetical protein
MTLRSVTLIIEWCYAECHTFHSITALSISVIMMNVIPFTQLPRHSVVQYSDKRCNYGTALSVMMSVIPLNQLPWWQDTQYYS